MEETNKVKELLEGPLREKGYSIFSISYARTSSGGTLSIVVDRDEAISLDDIVKVSELINPILDENDPIEGAYTLDVSSLGAEKPLSLDKLDHYLNHYVNIHLSHPYEGKNTLEGTLLEVDEDNITLRIKEKAKKKDIAIKREYLDKARLAIEF